ncbi:MAG: hypothetical protein ACLQI7_09235 [Streptosporangiaceae bacterium]
MSTAGTHHTQCCDQEIGEISKAAKALSESVLAAHQEMAERHDVSPR